MGVWSTWKASSAEIKFIYHKININSSCKNLISSSIGTNEKMKRGIVWPVLPLMRGNFAISPPEDIWQIKCNRECVAHGRSESMLLRMMISGCK